MSNAALNVLLKGEQALKNPHGYQALATRAAELEREGRYLTAHGVWLMAEKAATNLVNKHWARQRADLCHTCFSRFGKRVA